ncbi:MAG TPA: TatD family hydrolase [Verrucomicrobiota bacterium]|nr:TatD family hydrolase [Verrucomicrobiota bacterium]HNU52530.1 TatD family hydrolase [Verrucomicrobiota bacterium]
MTQFIDSHAHLTDRQFDADRDAAIGRAREAGVTRILCAGTDLETSLAALRLAEAHPGVYAAVGWHPNDADAAPPDVRPLLRPLLDHPKTIAVGEIGMDYYRLPGGPRGSSPERERCIARQREIFRQQLELAAQHSLPCVIHQRDCFAPLWTEFAPFAGQVRAQFHCFIGTPSELEQIIAAGSYVSFTGILTYPKAEGVRKALTAAPPGRFLLETDAPYLPPQAHRGSRCEPAHLIETARLAAQLRGLSLETLDRQTEAAARTLFPRLAAE